MPLSTRHKIIDQWKAARKSLDTCFYHLQYMAQLSEGQSEHINTNLPHIVAVLKEMDNVLLAFRENL